MPSNRRSGQRPWAKFSIKPCCAWRAFSSMNPPAVGGATVADGPEAAAEVGALEPAVVTVVLGREFRPGVQALPVVDQQGGARLEQDLVRDLAAGSLQLS